MKTPPENIDNVLHFADAQEKRRAKKYRRAACDHSKQNSHLCKKSHVGPRVEPPVIRPPANQREQRAGETHLCQRNQHLARLQTARMPSHQSVKQKKIDGRNKASRKRETAMTPAKPKREQ